MLHAEPIFDNAVMELEPVAAARHDQDRGTIAQRLGERCGRICYDSYGTGRSSELYHDHIRQVNHTSIYEHYNWTVDVGDPDLADLVNRPGIWYEYGRITLNARCLFDWELFGPKNSLYCTLEESYDRHYGTNAGIGSLPQTDEERWISFQITCSRGCSHELVRHKFRTAVSQRSTRYVDEARSDWCWHPEFDRLSASMKADVAIFKEEASGLYCDVVAELEDYIPRKQARGAARGVLGNALSTELIFSASVAQWKRMIQQRDNPAADAEIRTLFHDFITPVLETI